MCHGPLHFNFALQAIDFRSLSGSVCCAAIHCPPPPLAAHTRCPNHKLESLEALMSTCLNNQTPKTRQAWACDGRYWYARPNLRSVLSEFHSLPFHLHHCVLRDVLIQKTWSATSAEHWPVGLSPMSLSASFSKSSAGKSLASRIIVKHLPDL